MEENNVLEPQKESKKSMGREILEWIVTILVALIIALVIRNYIFTVARVDGASMLPTLTHNDRLIVWRLGYQPQKNDIIVLQQEGKPPYIKRIIATEGDTINIDYDNHTVSVNGKVLQEDYILEPTVLRGDVEFPLTIDEDHVFVLGDNRNNSSDSRISSIGQVKEEDIMGKAVLRFFPFDKFGSVTE